MKFLNIFSQPRAVIELLPLVLITMLLPFFHGGETAVAKFVFFAFPLLYFPLVIMRRRYYSKSIYLVLLAWLFFLFVNMLSMVFSISLAFSFSAFFKLFGYFVYFLLFYLMIERKSDLKIIYYSFILVGFILSLISFFYILFPPIGFPVMNFYYATYGHNHLANYLIFVLPIAINFFLQQRSRGHLSIFLVIFFFISLYLTFSRSAFLVIPLVTLFFLYYFKPTAYKRNVLLILGLFPIFVFSGLFLISNSTITEKFFSEEEVRSKWILRQTIKPIDSEGRIIFWKQAVKGFTDKPLLGHGPNTFRLISASSEFKEKVSWFAHSHLLQTASEAGLMGVLAFLILIFISFFRIRFSKQHTYYSVPLFVGAVGSLLQSLMSFNFEFLVIPLLFWIIISALLKISHKNRCALNAYLTVCLFFISLICSLFALSIMVSGFYNSKAKNTVLNYENLAYEYYKKSMLFPSIDNNRFLNFLKFTNYSFHSKTFEIPENFIIKWNKKDPDIFKQLTEYYYPSYDALRIIKISIPFSSSTEKYRSIGYALHSEVDDEDLVISLFFEALEQENLTTSYESESLEKNDHKNLMIKYIKRNYLLQDYTVYQMRMLASKVLYGVGFELLNKGDVNDASIYWNLARNISRDWDYYQIEMAALEYYKRDNSNLARQILIECLDNQYTRESCQNYLNVDLDFLPNPGTFKENIEDINLNSG